MNIDTYISFIQNEVRAVTITLRDQNYTAVTPTSASTFQVTDCEGSVVLTEANATVSSNTLTGIINTTVTATAGDYYIIWKIIDSDGYIYYHKTHLEVKELLGS
jgi:methionine-rich copper-binding protein CopC